MKDFNCQKWRDDFLWNAVCDYIFKNYLPALNEIFRLFSRKYLKPGM
jgi:hypothetical protein